MTDETALPPPVVVAPQPLSPPTGYVAYEATLAPTTHVFASWGRRAVGGIVNWLVGVAPWIPMMVLTDEGAGTDAVLLATAAGYLSMVGYLLAYATVVSRTGQWIGHWLVGTRIVRVGTLDPPSWMRAASRLTLAVVNTLPMYLGWLWPMWDSMRQTFADMLVDTVVIRTGAARSQVVGGPDSSATSDSI